VAANPDAKAYFELKSSKLTFNFPQPGFIEGIKSKGKALMKMQQCEFTYPVNDKPTITDITVQVSLSSRVACVGVNGAGKSTMIKLLTGEMYPTKGTVWKHPNARVAYVAQHAFHHIEQHLTKTPNEYIRWRYEHGEDKEATQKVTMTLTPEEEEICRQPVQIDSVDAKGNPIKIKRVIDRLTGARKEDKKAKEYLYEVAWEGMGYEANTFMAQSKLEKIGFKKHCKLVDEKVTMREGAYKRPLTQVNVEKHLEDVGLDREFGTHHRMSALSGGQKVKVVLAAALWNQPHIIILDEPTNYLDRESLGALATAIENFEGGVVMITHNNDFCSKLCPETWVLEKKEDGIGHLDCKGDPEWMKNVQNEKVEFKAMEEMVDAFGNTVKVKAPKKVLSRQEKKKRAKIRAAKIARGEEVSDDDEEDWE
jgi:elongation factor 3